MTQRNLPCEIFWKTMVTSGPTQGETQAIARLKLLIISSSFRKYSRTQTVLGSSGASSSLPRQGIKVQQSICLDNKLPMQSANDP